MKSLLRLAVVASSFVLLAGCAILSKEQMADLQTRHVAAETQRKIQKRETIDSGDVIELTRHKVPQEVVLKYIRRTGVTFLLTKDQTARMKGAGVSQAVIDLIATESQKYAADYAATHNTQAAQDFGPPPPDASTIDFAPAPQPAF